VVEVEVNHLDAGHIIDGNKQLVLTYF